MKKGGEERQQTSTCGYGDLLEGTGVGRQTESAPGKGDKGN